MSSYTSQKFKVFSVKTFVDSFKKTSPRKIGYIFLSKSSEYPNENVVPIIEDTVEQEKKVWDEMILAKKIEPKDIEFVIPRNDWRPGFRFKQYDDTSTLDELLTESLDGSQIVFPMYVLNADGDVYKCLSNNLNSISQVEPTGTFTQNNGFIKTGDGYVWKYLYNVKGGGYQLYQRSNKFLTQEWMPIPYIEANTSYVIYNYDSSSNSVIQGTLNEIVLSNTGNGYYHPTINVAPFFAGNTELTILDDIDLLTSNTINVNMSVSGTGIFPNSTYIKEVDPLRPKTIILSRPAISNGGGTNSSNVITISTRIEIVGDGTGTLTSVELSNNSLRRIEVVSPGINYTKANVIIHGSKSAVNGSARAILSPKLGHGYNPAIELGTSSVMLLSRIGEIDATENNRIPTDITFRQYGLLVNPYKYDGTGPLDENNSTDIVLQTFDLTLLSFSNFQINEMVYQGNINNPSFLGYVVYQSSNVVKLNNVFKQPVVGSLLVGSQSGNKIHVVNVKTPDLKPYNGDIVFARNILKVQRSIAQAEEVKLVFQF
jgi:hypothetical protein